MSKDKMSGYGYDWDAELVGGPCDGVIDIVVQLKGVHPPKIIYKQMDEDFSKEPKLGQKVLEVWASFKIPDNKRLAVYKLRGEPEDYNENIDGLFYDFQEITTGKDFKNKYQE